jgi:DNA-directed RNA polymerase specialized sigma24 family protein
MILNHQEWYDRFKARLGFDEREFVRQMELFDEWKGLRTAFIRMALNTLTPLQRKILTMICYHNFSERKVAELIGLSKSGVNREKWKAIEHLKRQFLMQFAARRV